MHVFGTFIEICFIIIIFSMYLWFLKYGPSVSRLIIELTYRRARNACLRNGKKQI